MMRFIIRYKYLLAILAIAIGFRFFHLGTTPNGFIPEEVSTGWNAYSLLKTARDEWGTFLPIIFRETGGFKLALNSYLIVPLIALFGLNEFAIRASTAIAGVLAVFLTYVFVQTYVAESVRNHVQRFSDKKTKQWARAAAFLFAISPWHIAMNRYGIDVNWGIPLFLGGLILFLKSNSKPTLLLPSAVLFALTAYTYFNYVLFTYLFVTLLIAFRYQVFRIPLRQLPKFIVNLNPFRKTTYRGTGAKCIQHKTYIFAFFLILVVFQLPYVTQKNIITRFSQATSTEKIGMINRIHEHRQACQDTLPISVCRIFYNRPVTFGLSFIKNWINHYSTTTYFVTGSNLGYSGMPSDWGFLYPFEFLLISVGMIVMIRKKLCTTPLVLWLALYGVPASLASGGHIWRMMTVLPLPQIIAGLGAVSIWNYLQKPARVMSIGVVLFFVAQFAVDYFVYFPYAHASFAYYGFRDAYRFADSYAKDFDRVVVDLPYREFDQPYIYYLFYTRYNPRNYQQGIAVERIVGEQNWVHVTRVGKWQFATSKYPVEVFNPDFKTLLITDTSFHVSAQHPNNMQAKLLQTITYPNNEVAFQVVSLASEK